MIDAIIRVFNGIIYIFEGVGIYFSDAGFWEVFFFLITVALLIAAVFWGIWFIYKWYLKTHLQDYYLKQLNDEELSKLIETNPNKVLIEQLHKIATYLRVDINHDIFQKIDEQTAAYSNYENVVTSVKQSLINLATRVDHVYQNSQEELSTARALKSQYQNLSQQLEEKRALIVAYEKGFLYSHFKHLVENVLSVISQLDVQRETLGTPADDLIGLLEINVLKPLNVFAYTPGLQERLDPKKMRVLADSKMAETADQQEIVYEVVSKGYQLIEGDIQRIIKYATVRAFKLNAAFNQPKEPEEEALLKEAPTAQEAANPEPIKTDQSTPPEEEKEDDQSSVEASKESEENHE